MENNPKNRLTYRAYGEKGTTTMKFTKKKGDTSTIRKVWSDDHEVCFGVVGTVGDLLAARIFDYCDYSKDAWAFIPAIGVLQKAWFGSSREAACEHINA